MGLMATNAFESFVNSEESKTIRTSFLHLRSFESFVNSEECKTLLFCLQKSGSLRALLIQKSVKPILRRTFP